MEEPVTLLCGDARQVLATLPEKSVHCCITSPPYWNLRDYQADGQIGLEETPSAYVTALVEVFRGVHRVLRDDGTCWIVIGDAYAGSWGNQGRKQGRGTQRPINGPIMQNLAAGYPVRDSGTGTIRQPGLKPKDLIGLPWMLAFALRDDGWWLRQELVFSKRNPMPESVKDRCTRAHETVFMLAKRPTYYFDQDSIREPAVVASVEERARRNGKGRHRLAGIAGQDGRRALGLDGTTWNPAGRNRRSVWTIATSPLRGARLLADYVGADGKPYKVSPDCPVHGPRHESHTWQVAGCDAPPAAPSRHSPDTSSCRASEPSSSLPPTPSLADEPKECRKRHGQMRNGTLPSRTCDQTLMAPSQSCHGTIGSPDRDAGADDADGGCRGAPTCTPQDALTATAHDTTCYRTDPAPATSPSGSASAQTPGHTAGTSGGHGSAAMPRSTSESRTSADACSYASSPSGQTESRTAGTSTRGLSGSRLNGNAAQCTCQEVTTEHYAAFPPELVRPMIRASTSEAGCCGQCGAPYRRVVERTVTGTRHLCPKDRGAFDAWPSSGSFPTSRLHNQYFRYEQDTTGWHATCSCAAGPPVPATVLDCFAGACTSALVARQEGRRAIMVDLNPDYLRLGAARLRQECGLFAGIADASEGTVAG